MDNIVHFSGTVSCGYSRSPASPVLTGANILVVENEADVLELISFTLRKGGFNVQETMSGEDGLHLAYEEIPDLIVLDLMLPGMNGFDFCNTIKSASRTKDISLIIVSARGNDADIVAGLELGADDYIPKPFSPRVLLARIRAVLRSKNRSPLYDNEILQYDKIQMDIGKHQVYVGHAPVSLSCTEFGILKLFLRRPGRLFSRADIIQEVHGKDYNEKSRSVDIQIVVLRKKLGETGKYIKTVRGEGYKLQR